MLAASEVKMSDSEKKKANKDITNNNFGEHIRHFLYKMCNWDVSRCHRAKQRQINVQKSVLHLQSFFFSNKKNCYFLPFSLPSPFSIT